MEFTNDVPTGISSFQAPTDTVGFAVGSGGLILKYEGDTITNQTEEDEIIQPNNFILHQNYPNPFNPSTKIKFTIPTSPLNPSPYQGEGNRERLITLKVYDVLGSEIATLVNEESATGGPAIYEIEFDASSLPSGIYFYQLRTGNFIDTKKMILLK